MHEPLSQKLAQILETNSARGHLTINYLLERTEGRGLYLVVMLLSLPFIVPVSIPGVITVFAYGLSAGTLIYLVVIASVLEPAGVKMYHVFQVWFQ